MKGAVSCADSIGNLDFGKSSIVVADYPESLPRLVTNRACTKKSLQIRN